MDVSNKFLVFLLVIAILVTVVGTFYSIGNINKFALITGYQTEGNVTVNITERAEINVTQPNCDFGSGYVTAPFAYAVLYTSSEGIAETGQCESGSDHLDNWTNTTTYDPDCMVIRNDGNKNLKINVSSGKNASEFIGGTSPEYKVWSENKEGGSCTNGGLINFTDRVDMDKTNITLCSNFSSANSSDEIYAGCYLRVPDDAIGYKSDTWTFYGVAA